ncbi:MAG TPA: HIT family protein [bacterium]|nr:HIT family protein [bacterium]HNS33820.1 HIT family protein [bacterium]
MTDCIFCRIIAGEIPSDKIYEDDEVVAFLDIAPVNPGHVLVIPKAHYPDLLALPEQLAVQLVIVARKIAPAIITGVGAAGFNLTLNNGVVAGQAVGHVHLHLIPRFKDDGRELWSGQPYPAGEAAVVVEKIRKQL